MKLDLEKRELFQREKSLEREKVGLVSSKLKLLEDLDLECLREAERFKKQRGGGEVSKFDGGESPTRSEIETISQSPAVAGGRKSQELPARLRRKMTVIKDSGLEKAPFLMMF